MIDRAGMPCHYHTGEPIIDETVGAENPSTYIRIDGGDPLKWPVRLDRRELTDSVDIPELTTKENTMNNEEQQNNNLTQTAPERIWLHPGKQGDILFTEDEAFPESGSYEHGRTYWNDSCDHSGSVPYIRADLAGQEVPQLLADALNCIMDCYQFMDTYGTVYEPCDIRGDKQQELLDRMRGLIKLVADLPTAPQAEAEEGE